MLGQSPIQHPVAVVLIPCPPAGSSTEVSAGDAPIELVQSAPQQKQQLDASVLALDLSLGQACVYASQRRLCITAALVKAVQEVQEGLVMCAQPRTTALPTEVTLTPKVWLCCVAPPGFPVCKCAHCAMSDTAAYVSCIACVDTASLPVWTVARSPC